MAKTLFELAQEYLNQGMPDINQTPRVVTPPGTNPPTQPGFPSLPPTERILPMPGGGGGDFSVYNPDPNSTRTQNNYSPYASRQASERSYIGAPGDYSYSSGTEAQKMMDNYPEYYQGKQLEGIPGAAQNYLKNSFLGKGLSALGDKLPVNRRAILENELLGSGFQLNDIGQIVSNDVNTVEGVMSGYNASKMDASTFDNRIEKIKNRKAPQTKASRQKISLIEQAKNKFLSASDKSTDVFDMKSLQKNPDYVSQKDSIAAGIAANDVEETGMFDSKNNIFAAKDKLTDPNITSNMINEFGFGGEYGSADDNFPSAPPTTVDMINEFGFGGEYGSADDNFPSAPVATPTVDQLNEFGYGGGYGSSDDNFPSNPITTPVITPAMINEFGFGGGYGSADDNFPSAPVATPTAEMINEFGTNPTYDPGPFDYQMQPSNVYQGGGSDNSSVSPSGDVTSPSGQYQGNINDEFAQPAPSYQGGTTTRPGSGGGGDPGPSNSKIVCTMMNESYGFGSFRNKIWMKFHKDIAPEYQKGYHKIFLPLIKIAKTNKIIKKVLEHIAVHSTIDMRQATRGKTHLLGRIYRKIILPLCYLVGKHG